MDIKDKCLSGYRYTLRNEEQKLIAITGIGGAHMFIDVARKEGLTDEQISEIIYVQTDEHGDVPLKYLSVTKKKQGEDVGDIPDNQ